MLTLGLSRMATTHLDVVCFSSPPMWAISENVMFSLSNYETILKGKTPPPTTASPSSSSWTFSPASVRRKSSKFSCFSARGVRPVDAKATVCLQESLTFILFAREQLCQWNQRGQQDIRQLTSWLRRHIKLTQFRPQKKYYLRVQLNISQTCKNDLAFLCWFLSMVENSNSVFLMTFFHKLDGSMEYQGYVKVQ